MSTRGVAINMPDAIVIGCGGGGAVVAKELAEAGLGVVALEAGPWHDPARDFTALEWDMMNGFDSVFRWGPADRSKPAWPRVRDGLALAIQTAGVGGNTLHYGANCPRGYPESFERDWPFPYAELAPYYRKVEETLPVAIPDIASLRDELFIRGCDKMDLPHVISSDVRAPGWRMQPNAILPIGRASDATPSGCTQCGECIVGCRHPANASAESAAKRGTNVSYAPLALATGRCEIRTGSFVTSILTHRTRDGLAAHGVRYRDESGRVYEQDSRVVVLAGGAIESPRLWLASGLPTSPAVGGYFTTHWFDYVSGEFDDEVDMHDGQTSMVRCDFPGLGFIETQGLGPLLFAFLSFLGPNRPGGGPWKSRGRVWGSALKRRMEAYRRTVTLVVCVDDDALPGNGVSLSDGVRDVHNAAPLIRYHANAATEARRDLLARKAAEILLAAGARPESIHRADALPSTVHQHGTLRMGTDAGGSVLDADCEAHMVKRLFAADTSVFSNGIGGPNPTLTAQALATRTAEKIVQRYFS
jgi:choline dehydrogenase-like flavoprotein